jgi:hypothetical protein
MPPPDYKGPERRKRSHGRRDDDEDAMARFQRIEEQVAVLQNTLTQHLTHCEEAHQENREAQVETARRVAALQTETGKQTKILNDVDELLPWLRESHASAKFWREMWRAVGQFFWGMVKKNWDSMSGKLIFVVLGIYLAAKGVPWTELLKWL